MKELIAIVAVYLFGLSAGYFAFSDHPQMYEVIGATYPELSSMKEECEHSLPRNQHCISSIIFTPTASEE